MARMPRVAEWFGGLLVRGGARLLRGSGANGTELASILNEAAEQEAVDADDRELIHSVFAFGDTVVREVMVPRTDMVTLDAAAPITAAMEAFMARRISRIPLIGGDVDEVRGVLYLRDVVAAIRAGRGEEPSTSIAKPAIFVPDSMAADALLRLMQARATHMALVVDEYGGIAGLATLEDLIEELVGDIADEYDRDLPDAVELEGGRWRVNARLHLDELGERLDIELEDEDVDSVGGLLQKALGRLPIRGDTVEAGVLRITAERVERRRVMTVIVERIAPDGAAPAASEEPA